ncbi:MAG: hypothetical protein QQN41_12535 [Nitrosopumilus sp.]
MLVPEKHTSNSKSILGLGCFVLEFLSTPKTLDEIWTQFRKARKEEQYSSSHSFDNLILALDFLFSIGVVNEHESGKIFKCD